MSQSLSLAKKLKDDPHTLRMICLIRSLTVGHFGQILMWVAPTKVLIKQSAVVALVAALVWKSMVTCNLHKRQFWSHNFFHASQEAERFFERHCVKFIAKPFQETRKAEIKSVQVAFGRPEGSIRFRWSKQSAASQMPKTSLSLFLNSDVLGTWSCCHSSAQRRQSRKSRVVLSFEWIWNPFGVCKLVIKTNYP